MAKQMYTKDERKAQFLKAGLAIAKKDSIAKVSAAAVAKKCGVTAPLVFHCFGTTPNLQLAIKREAKKQGVKLADPKPVRAAITRKRSIAEVKAIKNKTAAPKANAKNRAASPGTPKPKVRKVVRSAKSGKFVDKGAAKRSPATTVTQKYATNPVPAPAMPAEPKNSL